MLKHLNELEALSLPKGKYAIFGSGPLAIRGIRESNDIDIIVKLELWQKLVEKYADKQVNEKLISIGNIEIYKSWKPWFENVNELIEQAEEINGLPFVKLDYVLQWKKEMGREKDLRDVELINKNLEK